MFPPWWHTTHFDPQRPERLWPKTISIYLGVAITGIGFANTCCSTLAHPRVMTNVDTSGQSFRDEFQMIISRYPFFVTHAYRSRPTSR
jgi:hypothetical protein